MEQVTAKKLTPEELDSVLRKKDFSACRDYFAGASEKERKTVAARALEWYEVATAFESIGSQFVRAMLGFSETSLPKRTQQQLALTRKVDKGELSFPSEVKDKESVAVARLAVAACASLTDIRKCGMPPADFAFEVMRDRNPKWMGKWLNFACERGWSNWLVVRAIEKHGIANAEREDDYFNSMAYTLGQKDVVDLSEYINADAELKESLLWEMLNNDAAIKLLADPSSVTEQSRAALRNFNITDWNMMGIQVEGANRASFNWRLALIHLAEKGDIDKARLLDYTFEWLARLSGDRDSRPSAKHVSNTSPTEWFQQLHDELSLSAEEKSAYAIRYISLLSVRDAATLSWAVKGVSSCDYSSLPLDDLFANITRVFYHKRKEPSLAAFQLLDQLSKLNQELLFRCSEVVVEAFEHPSNEIQKKAISFLKRNKTIQHPLIVASLEPRLERLSALIRNELTDILQAPDSSQQKGGKSSEKKNSKNKLHVGDGQDNDSVVNSAMPLSENASTLRFLDNGAKQNANPLQQQELQELIAAARLIEGDLAIAAELHEAIKAAEEKRPAPPLSLTSRAFPRLDEKKRIQPVEDLDELIFLFLHIVERTATTDDGERLMDGISRLHHLHPQEFDSMVSSLKKKLDPLLEFIDSQGDNARVPYYVRIAHAWFAKKRPKENAGFLKQLGNAFTQALFTPVLSGAFEFIAPNSFLIERAHAIARTIKKGKPLPLLAAPTHSGGWIDPAALPERLEAWRKENVIPEDADIVQALLRLAPENRDEALSRIPPDGAEHIRAIRWALGAEMIGDAQTAHIWVAAFRCREPEGSSEYLKNRFRDLGPDSAQAAAYSDNTESYAKRQDSIYGVNFSAPSQHNLPVLVSPEVRNRSDVKMFPTELLNVSSVFFEAEPMMELYFPLHRESFFANQANRTAMFLTSSGTYWASEWNCLFDSDVRLTGTGTWLLVISLSAKQSEAARLALDATITGIEDTRLDGGKFGFVMARFFRTGFITLSRWMTAFKDIARISPLHTEFCLQALETCLAQIGDEYKEKPPVPMIECLYDAAQSTGSCITNPACRAFLEGIQSKGKAAKLGKLLLELDGSGRSEHVDAVNLQILRSRMDRIERWKSQRCYE